MFKIPKIQIINVLVSWISISFQQTLSKKENSTFFNLLVQLIILNIFNSYSINLWYSIKLCFPTNTTLHQIFKCDRYFFENPRVGFNLISSFCMHKICYLYTAKCNLKFISTFRVFVQKICSPLGIPTFYDTFCT